MPWGPRHEASCALDRSSADARSWFVIYLDHNATTPLRPEVVEAMTRVLRDVPGNPSSTHALGRTARGVVEAARDQLGALVGAAPGKIVFTGSATEANNAALHGAAGPRGRGAHLVTTTIEHPSVAEPASLLEKQGAVVTRIGVDSTCRVDPDELAAALRPGETALVSVILANNETGVIQDVARIGELAAEAGVPLHVDATQAVGKIPVDVGALGASLLCGTAHKLNGPKGVGFLVDAGRTPSEPYVRGGPQERRRRGGTENVAGICGLGVAADLARQELGARAARHAALRDRLEAGLRAAMPGLRRNGVLDQVLPNTLSIVLEGVPGDVLVEALDGEGIAVSAGAACHSGSVSPSATLLAMGLDAEQARGSLRLSVGHGVDADQIDHVVKTLPVLAERVRGAAA